MNIHHYLHTDDPGIHEILKRIERKIDLLLAPADLTGEIAKLKKITEGQSEAATTLNKAVSDTAEGKTT